MSIRVSEIFASIQGESSYAGAPCGFIRLSGCNLRCSYCDTRYAWSGGQVMDIAQAVEKVLSFGTQLIEITGGEPLLQPETPELVKQLLDQGRSVLVETNGTLDISSLDSRCVRIVDIKCPSSGQSHENDELNIGRLRDLDEVKFVMADRVDYEFARGMAAKVKRASSAKVHFSPVHGVLDPKDLACWILSDRLDVRLGFQLHKVIWGADERGV